MDGASSCEVDFSSVEFSQLESRSNTEPQRVWRPARRENAVGTLLAVNDTLVCWSDGGKLWARMTCVEDVGNTILSLSLRKDSNILALVTSHRLLVLDFDRENRVLLTFSKTDGFSSVHCHPTQAATLATTHRRELTLWLDYAKAKAITQSGEITAFAFSADGGNTATVTLDSGVVRTIDFQSESVLFEVSLGARSALHMPGSLLPILANGKLELWNWAKRDKEQTISLPAGTNFSLVAWENYVILVDFQRRKLLIFNVAEGRFSGVCEVALETDSLKSVDLRQTAKGEVELCCLGTKSVDFYVLKETGSTGDRRKQREKRKMQEPLAAMHRKLDDLSSRIDSTLLSPSLQSALDRTVSSHLDQLSTIVRDEQQKIQISMKVLLAQAFKEQFQSTISPLFEGAVKEMFTRVSSGFQEGVKDFAERNAVEEAKFQSVMQHMKGSVDATTDLTHKLGKMAFQQLQRITDLEAKQMTEEAAPAPVKPSPRPVAEVPALKLELDKLLRNGEFEEAVALVLAESDERLLYRVLRLLNPTVLYSERPLSSPLSLQVCHRLLTHFPTTAELPDYVQWLVTICKSVVLKGEDPALLQSILEMMLSRSKTSPEIAPAKEVFFSKIMQDMQERPR